jgi:hypothetical protein
VVRDAVGKATHALRGERADARFTELFVENVIVAAVARSTYKEPPLTNEDVARYLRESRQFFNSYFLAILHRIS